MSLVGVPDAGWRFDRWTGDVESIDNPLVLTVTADLSVTATFVQQHTLSVAIIGDGTVDSVDGLYDDGEPVTLNAVPADGWRFDRWKSDVESIDNPLALTVTADLSVTATFVQQHTLSVAIIGDGTVDSVDGL